MGLFDFGMIISYYLTGKIIKDDVFETKGNASAFAIFNFFILLLQLVITLIEIIFSGKYRFKAFQRAFGGCSRTMRKTCCCDSKYDKDGFRMQKTIYSHSDKKDEDIDWEYFNIDNKLDQKEETSRQKFIKERKRKHGSDYSMNFSLLMENADMDIRRDSTQHPSYQSDPITGLRPYEIIYNQLLSESTVLAPNLVKN